MKKDTHPDYQDVLFEDSSTGAKFLIGSTLKPKETETFEGKKYPVYRVSVSSASHPFFTGSSQLVDAEGRVDKFTKRYQKKQVQAQEQIAKQEKESEKKETKTGKSAKKPSKAVSKKK